MTKVFVGGSRHVSRLNELIRTRAKNIASEKLQVLVGDANGADRALQEFFAQQLYDNVLVFCSGRSCRNNLNNWPVKQVNVDARSKGYEYYTAKDLAMAKEADYGFMLWDGKSAGTAQNIVNLLTQGKFVVVYFAPKKQLITVRAMPDFENLLHECHEADLPKILARIQQYTSSSPVLKLLSPERSTKAQMILSEGKS